MKEIIQKNTDNEEHREREREAIKQREIVHQKNSQSNEKYIDSEPDR